jgi:hypothetical protein
VKEEAAPAPAAAPGTCFFSSEPTNK